LVSRPRTFTRPFTPPRQEAVAGSDLAARNVLVGCCACSMLPGPQITLARLDFIDAKPRPLTNFEVLELDRPALERAVLGGKIEIAAAWLENLQSSELSAAALTRWRRQLWLCANQPLLQKRNTALGDLHELPCTTSTRLHGISCFSGKNPDENRTFAIESARLKRCAAWWHRASRRPFFLTWFTGRFRAKA
jgi:DNA-binding transcriptional LysR family regulator